MMKNNYKWLFILLLGFTTACSDDDSSAEDMEPVVELTAGEADFSNFVSIGNSLAAGFTDGALFAAAQQNSLPNILAQQFALAGGGEFTQPLMSDNVGGLLFGGQPNPDFAPRLVFDLASQTPVPLQVLNETAASSTEVFAPSSAPYNNVGVPGAKSFHLLFNGYGNPAGLLTDPPTANPYFIRMASAADATMLGDALSQGPSFFSLWIGANDVLGYATAGGDINENQITDEATFTFAYTTILDQITSVVDKGVVANIPDIRALPHFTTVPYAPLDPTNASFGPQIPTLNTVFGALNPIFEAIDPSRSVVFFTDAASPVLIKDENLADIGPQIVAALNASDTFPIFIQQFGLPAEAAPLVANLLGSLYGQSRQATESDLLVLPSSSVIGTVNVDAFTFLQSQGLPAELAGQFSVEGVTNPLADKWVLTPEEQDEIATATTQFNSIINSALQGRNLAFVDANALMNQLATTGLSSGDFTLTGALVQGGAISLDGIHTTARGNALLANKFLEAIDATYGSTFVASGNVANLAVYPTNYPAQLP